VTRESISPGEKAILWEYFSIKGNRGGGDRTKAIAIVGRRKYVLKKSMKKERGKKTNFQGTNREDSCDTLDRVRKGAVSPLNRPCLITE